MKMLSRFVCFAPMLAIVTLIACSDEPSTTPPDGTTPPSGTNRAPIAEAGENRIVRVGQRVEVTALASSDPDNDPLVVSWSMMRPEGSQAELTGSFRASFTPDVAGDYVLTLTVSDGQLSATDRVTLRATASGIENRAPMANAGEDQVVPLGVRVILDGTHSVDPDGDELTYQWRLVSGPAGNAATLDAPNSAVTGFTPTLAGDYAFNLVVNDGALDSMPSAMLLTVLPETSGNTAPVADAGGPIQTSVGESVTLDGSASSDADGDPLTYQWTVLMRPTGSQAMPTTPTNAVAAFTPDVAGVYELQLTVNDGQVSHSTTVRLDVAGMGANPPVAYILASRRVPLDEPVVLNGSASVDPDNDPLTYQWRLVSKPAGSNATLMDATNANASFTPDVLGDYTVELVVNDGTFNSPAVQLVITATDGSISCLIFSEYIEGSSNNKAIELFNCGTSTLDLATFGVCLFSNDSNGVTCSNTLILSGGLPPGEVVTVCSSAISAGVLTDPSQCDFRNATANFNGDDRLLIFEKTSAGIGYTNGVDQILDAFGHPSTRPAANTWADVGFRRCDFTPFIPPGAFDVNTLYTRIAEVDSFDDLGVAPVAGCQGGVNGPPTAHATGPARGRAGQPITLSCTTSSDPEDDALACDWTIATAPAGSVATLSDPMALMPTFTPDVDGDYTFSLIVTDSQSNVSAPVTLSFTAGNTAPVAIAMGSAQVNTGVVTILDGTGSNDPERDALTYLWAITAAPAGSAATLDDATLASPRFTPDLDGDYTLTLTVNDGDLDSAVATLTLTASTPTPLAECLIFSEYLEGDSNNKAFELYNCGTQGLDLSLYKVCQVNGSLTACNRTYTLSGMLAAGDVVVLCHPHFASSGASGGRCELIPSEQLMQFNGDDKLAIFDDVDNSNALSAGDRVLDAFGNLTQSVGMTTWQDKTYRRCALTPYDGTGPFVVLDHYTQHAKNDATHLGTPPAPGGCP